MKPAPFTREALLVLPPFGSFDAPYISLAVLAGHLKSCGIPVGVLNASAFLVKHYCTRSRLAAGIAAIHQSFSELNEKACLMPSEAAKLTVLYPLLSALNQYGVERLPPGTALQVAAFPAWPDCLVERPFVKLISDCSIFDSNDLVRAARKDYFFTELLRGELRRSMAATTPLLVGITTVFYEQMPAALHCARLIKELAPSAHVTMGGPFITAHMEELNNPDFFDFVDTLIFDEGEIPLQRLYEALHAGALDLEHIPGIMYLAGNTSITKNVSAPPPDMETLAFADYSSCSLDQYPIPLDAMRLNVRLSRGCYWKKCSFCRTHVSFCKNYQQPSVDRLFSELQHIVQTTGVKRFHFSDESSNPLVLEKLSRKMIESDLGLQWSFHTRIDKLLNRERVSLYKQAGCQIFHVGIETFSNRLLRIMQKGITQELIDEVLEEVQGIIPIHAYMMVGIPGETEEEAEQSYAMAQAYKKKGRIQGAVYSLFQLVPGSDMWKHPKKYRIHSLQSTQGHDLKPDICADFVVEDGMTRTQAFALFFRYLFPEFASWKNQILALAVDGSTIPCRYPLGYLQEYLHDSLIYQNDLPFQRWLEFLDENNGPIVPYGSQQ